MSRRKKQKPYWDMTTAELAEATKEFDDPNYDPPAVKPTKAQLSQLKRCQRKRDTRRATLSLSLDQELIEQADDYATSHGITFSDVVSDALRQLMRKKSA
jgi:hypothetical protein